jgi:hypothetical protein
LTLMIWRQCFLACDESIPNICSDVEGRLGRRLSSKAVSLASCTCLMPHREISRIQ